MLMMKAVLMCAGKSTRTYPLTLTRPKPLLKVANKTLLEHNLEQLSGIVDEAIIIIGFMGEQIKEKLGTSFCTNSDKIGEIKLSYAEQKEQLGTAHALLQAEPLLEGRFSVLMGDDLYNRADIERCIKHGLCILGKEVEDPRRFGVISMGNGRMTGLVEKPANPPTNLANTGMYVLDDKIFPIIRGLKRSERGEYEITDAVAELARKELVSVEIVKGYWLPIGYPWSLLEANEVLLKSKKGFRVEGKIEKGAVVKGGVEIGKGALVMSGSCIEGPVSIGMDCVIGPNCFIRPFTSIGDGCHIGNGVDIRNSIIMGSAKVPHLSYVGDSVIGEGTNIGGGGMTVNLRHDGASVKSMVGGELIDTGRRKFGAIIGDGAKLGAGTLIYPGRKIWPGKTTKPGEVVKADIE